MVRPVSVAHVFILVLLIASCGEKNRTTLGNFDNHNPQNGKGIAPGTGVNPDQLSQIPLFYFGPLSGRLGCGEPCDTKKVDEAGRCADRIAVRCEDGVIVCDECVAGSGGCVESEDEPARCVRDCEGEEICPPGSECYTRLCCPDTQWCERDQVVFCDETGTNMFAQKCIDGLDCIEGQCLQARSMIHILFDTSGSMTSGGTSSTWPACDAQPASSRIGISKEAFSALFTEDEFQHTLFALQRFPQIRLGGNTCPNGGYLPTGDNVSGHTDNVVAIQESDQWFASNIGETILVPFPRGGEPNRDVLLSWMNFSQGPQPTAQECDTDEECPLGGACGKYAKPPVCYVSDEELRASGMTPLGHSLFYAGEYIRLFVVADGIECKLDADCPSSTYFCQNGECTDPNRDCRQRAIVVFTDGGATDGMGANGPDFYDTAVQARRLHAGLTCKLSVDCAAGFACDNGTCQPANNPNNPCAPFSMSCPQSTLTFQHSTDAGADRLVDRKGKPIQLNIHVVDISGSTNNAVMAAYGGGLLVSPSAASGADLLKELKPVVNWKDVTFCGGQ